MQLLAASSPPSGARVPRVPAFSAFGFVIWVHSGFALHLFMSGASFGFVNLVQ